MSNVKDSINLAPDLTAALIGLFAWSTSTFKTLPNNISANVLASFSIKWNVISIGNIIITARMLKKSCTVDAAKARLNSFPLFICPTETMVFVTVVPILAPMIIGIAPEIPRAPLLTMPTIKEVVVEEL